ncbi:MAG TPA: hypothetical protein VHJ34_06325 [Actinomycetota bacterium]|nr:hypothetical protein [Actinomycetota bacterium]
MELSQFVADVDGHQRKIVMAAARPRRVAHGDSGIPLRDGRTLPFVVERAWNAPAGHYTEAWYLVDPETREVVHEGAAREVAIRGLLTWTELADDVTAPFELAPGTYLLVFALDGVMGGQVEVHASEAPAEEAA